MKNINFKKILSAVLFAAVVLATVFAISSCKEHVHEFETTVTKAATCTEEGLAHKVCACGYEEDEVIPASGHTLVHHDRKFASCTEAGYHPYDECTVCGWNDFFEISKFDHVPGNPVRENEVEFTCTENGSYDEVVYCKECENEISRVNKPILTPGHDFQPVAAKAATCTIGWYDHEECTLCGEKKGYEEIAPKYDHIWSEHPIELKDTRVNPTCTEDGYYEEAICCTHDCGTILGEVGIRVLEKLGHDTVKYEAQAPDCVNKGWNAFEVCTRDNCEYHTYVEIPALGHTGLPAVVENRVEPTCDKAGHYEDVVYCEVCHAEVSRTKVEIPALGHDYVDHEGKANSCTEIGWNAYRTCTRCDYTEYKEIAAHGHNPVEGDIENFVEPTCTTEGSYDRVFYCSICEVELKRESWTVPAVAHNTLGVVDAKTPTCTEAGHEAYICCSKCGYTANEIVVIPALGHKLTKYEAKAPTCTEAGYEAYEVCSECDHNTFKEIPATGHDIVTLPAVANSCETDGLTAGQYCKNCDDQTVAQQIIPAIGHNRDEDGLCANCGNKMSLGLDYVEVDGGLAFTGVGDCEDKDIVIPDEVNGVKVVAVAANAFKRSDIESVVIPATVKVIGAEAFFSCTSLKSVVIGAGVESIGENAFFGCFRLTTVTISSDVKTIGANAFGSCYKLATVYYDGTAAEWAAIVIGENNEKLTGAQIIFN